MEDGSAEVWKPGPRKFALEPKFVPRPGGEAEDAGWLLAPVFNAGGWWWVVVGGAGWVGGAGRAGGAGGRSGGVGRAGARRAQNPPYPPHTHAHTHSHSQTPSPASWSSWTRSASPRGLWRCWRCAPRCPLACTVTGRASTMARGGRPPPAPPMFCPLPSPKPAALNPAQRTSPPLETPSTRTPALTRCRCSPRPPALPPRAPPSPSLSLPPF